MNRTKWVRSVLIGGALALAGASAYAQVACPLQTGARGETAVNIAVSPSPTAENEPFTITALVCYVGQVPPPGTNTTVTITVTAYLGTTILFSGQSTTDANGMVFAYLGAGLPAFGQYDINIAVPGGFDGVSNFYISGPPSTVLRGAYAFLFQGVNALPADGVVGAQAAMAGFFSADGFGHLTGNVDVNTPAGVLENADLSGSTYTLDANGRGTFTLVTPLGSQTFKLSVDISEIIGGHSNKVVQGDLSSVAGSAFVGNGSVKLAQTLEDFPGRLLMRLDGETACDASCISAGGHATPLTSSGQLITHTMDVGPLTYESIFNQTVGTTAQSGLTESGSIEEGEAYYRGVLTVDSSSDVGEPKRFAIYTCFPYYDIYGMFILSLDPHNYAPLLSGTAIIPTNP